jgi:hypothetical protein
VAPRGKTRIVGFQILAPKYTARHHLAMHQQHTTIPDRGLLAPQRRKERIDLRSPFVGEGPGFRHEGKVQSINMKYR